MHPNRKMAKDGTFRKDTHVADDTCQKRNAGPTH